MSTTFNYSNSKFKVTCKNMEFECRTHTKEKQSKMSSITVSILPLPSNKQTNKQTNKQNKAKQNNGSNNNNKQKTKTKIFKLNGHPEYF